LISGVAPYRYENEIDKRVGEDKKSGIRIWIESRGWMTYIKDEYRSNSLKAQFANASKKPNQMRRWLDPSRFDIPHGFQELRHPNAGINGQNLALQSFNRNATTNGK
jgi:hypothetical protein